MKFYAFLFYAIMRTINEEKLSRLSNNLVDILPLFISKSRKVARNQECSNFRTKSLE